MWTSYVERSLVGQCNLHGVLAVVQGVFPRTKEEDQPQLPGGVTFEDVLDGDEVLQGLRHLAAGDGQVAGVQEVADPVVVVKVGLKKFKNDY